MGTIKDRNDTDLTEAEDIKKMWQEYTEELQKKGLNDPDNHDGVVTHLEPDTLGVKSRRPQVTKGNYKQGEKTAFRNGRK